MHNDVWTIGSILKWTEQYFAAKGVESPRLDAQVLLSHILKKERIYLYVYFDQPLEGEELSLFREAVKRRAQRVPVAYILGYKEFMGLDFIVTPDVLIPRPDTEILVEAVISRLQIKSKPRLADIGTGSGAIIVSVLKNVLAAQGVAVDLSKRAIVVAEQNACKHDVAGRVEFLHGDLYEPIQEDEKFDVIVSNPPYIPNADIDALEPEVQTEPRGALAGGKDGLDFYRRLISNGAALLKPGGFLAVEVGFDQAEAVAGLGAQSGTFGKIDKLKDYSGIDRVVLLEKREND